METMLNQFEIEVTCTYKGESYCVRNNGAILRHRRKDSRSRPLDEMWTFGRLSKERGYMSFSSELVHRIVATAFHGPPPTQQHVIDHKDTNKRNNRPENLHWLWEIKRYSNNLIALVEHKSSSQEDIQSVGLNKKDDITKEIKVYNEQDHIAKGSPETVELYREFKERVLNLGDLVLVPMKQYLGFKYGKKVVTDLEIQKSQLKVRINLKKGQLDDPRGLFRDVSGIGHWGVGDYETKITTDSDMDYLMSLVKQSYKFYSSE